MEIILLAVILSHSKWGLVVAAADSIPADLNQAETWNEARGVRESAATDSGVNVSDPGHSEDSLLDSGNVKKDVWVVGLFPLRGSWPGGLGQLPAVQMGLEHVNADPNILRGYRLRMTVEDTECDAGIGTNALYRQLYQPPTKLLVLGAGCSEVSQATAQASHLWNLLQVSYSSASPALSAKDVYKRFFRVFPPESSFNPAKFDLLDYFRWKKVGTIYEATPLFTLTTIEFVKRAPDHGIRILTSESFFGDPRQQVRNLKKQGVRIIVGNFYENKARVIFCEAYKEKMYGPMYVWIITGFYSPGWWRKNPGSEDPHDCTPEQLDAAVEGYFTADALPLSRWNTPGISGRTHKAVIAEYFVRTENVGRTGHQEAPYGYDSVWTIALMLNNSIRHMKEQGWNKSIEDFNYNDTQMANLFWNLTSDTSFEGVSGPVMFDENGDRRGLTQIEQLQGGREVTVGVYDPSIDKANRIVWDEERRIVWSDSGIPTDSVLEKVTRRVVNGALFILMTVLASIGIVVSFFFLVFNIRYRHRKYIKMSSPNMNNFILFGAIFAFSSIIFGGTETNLINPFTHLAMCKFYNWTLALGFSLAFGAMFSKTWRVHKIFTNKKIQRMVIKDYQLMALVFVLVLFDVLVLTVWEFVSPLEVVVYNTTADHLLWPLDDNQVVVLQSRYCESSYMWYFAGVLFAVKGLLLLFGAFLAFETRKVTAPALNDSKFIGISVYNVVVLCLIGVPTAIMIKEQIDAAYTLTSLFTFFATALTICLVFIPKALKRNLEPYAGTMWMKATESTVVTQRKTCATQLTSSGGGGGGGGQGRMRESGRMEGVGSTVSEKLEIERLIEENSILRQTLEDFRCRFGCRQELFPFTESSSPQTEEFPNASNVHPSSSMPSLSTDKIYAI